MGGNQTTVTVVALAGAIATLILSILHYYFMPFMVSAGTAVDGAIQTIIMGLACYYLPAWGHPDNKTGPNQP